MKKIILSLTALTAVSLCAHAQVSVSTSTVWNTLQSDLLTQVFTSTTTQQTGGITATTAMQQTFTVSEAFAAESFNIRFRQGGPLTLSVHAVADANQANPLTLGTQVFSASINLTNVGATTTTATFTFDTPLALGPGAYAFQISTVSATAFEWRRTTNAASGGNVYAGGRAYVIDPLTGSNANVLAGSSEFALAIVASPIPEPSSFALLAGTLALGLTALRRRR